MKISNTSANISFGKIFQVVGTKHDINELKTLISDEQKKSGNPVITYSATNFFSSLPQTKNQLDDKDVFFVVTGKDYEEEIRNNDSSDFLYLIACSDRLIKLGNDVKKEAFEILNSIKNNF